MSSAVSATGGGVIVEACETLLRDGERGDRNRIIVRRRGQGRHRGHEGRFHTVIHRQRREFHTPRRSPAWRPGIGERAGLPLLFSYSGESVEVIRLAGELRRIGCAVVVITSRKASTLGRMAAVCIETARYGRHATLAWPRHRARRSCSP